MMNNSVYHMLIATYTNRNWAERVVVGCSERLACVFSAKAVSREVMADFAKSVMFFTVL